MLEWQTIVMVGGLQYPCLESYESLNERLRDGTMKQSEDEEGSRMSWLPPLELTFKTSEDKVIRALVPAHSIAAVFEIPVADREPLERA